MVLVVLLAMYGMAAVGIVAGYALHGMIHEGKPGKFDIHDEVDEILDALEL